MNKSNWEILARFGATPDNLSVGGSLDLRGTCVTELPDNLSVGGSLYLRGTCVTELPDNLSVGGSLYLEGTGVTELPDNLSVGGSLYLEGTGVAELLKDDRGYRLHRAGERYIAGRRNFSASEALGHWGAGSYPDRERGDAFVAAVRKEEARRTGGASQ